LAGTGAAYFYWTWTWTCCSPPPTCCEPAPACCVMPLEPPQAPPRLQ
jgi:hypothetical protein